MFCKFCGAQLEDTAAFCAKCGKQMTPGAAKKKRNKVLIIIIVGLILAIIAVAAFLVISRLGNADDGEEDEQETWDISEEDMAGEWFALLFKTVDTDVPVPSIAVEDITAEEASSAPVSTSQESLPESRELQSRELQSRELQMSQPQTSTEKEEYILPESDSRYLDIEELYGLSKEECRIARNELFARHGRKFADEELQDYFNSCSWYHGTIEPDDFDDSVLNDYEVYNRDLIVEYEEEQGYR